MMMETAYLAAIVPHQKRPPKLEALLVPLTDRPPARRQQSAAEAKAVMRQIFASRKKPT